MRSNTWVFIWPSKTGRGVGMALPRAVAALFLEVPEATGGPVQPELVGSQPVAGVGTG